MQILHTEPVEGRKCGDCTACCTAVAVKELGKDIWTRCRHELGHGCSVYESRPGSCKAYQCLWLSGHFGLEGHRPDLFGLIVQVQESDKFERPVLLAWETRAGALQNPKVRYAVERMCRRTVVYIFPHGEPTRRIIQGPEEMLAKAGEIVEHTIGQRLVHIIGAK